VLWAALIINITMFGVELAGGLQAGSASLLADAVDFFGDAANYGISLLVLGMALTWRARAALFKGLAMGAFGVFVLGRAAWSAASGTVPEPVTMGAIGALALLANVSVAAMLYAWREGDANMRSVWLCSRNDAIGNLAVMAAALGVFGTGSGWPDLAVAAVMGVWRWPLRARSSSRPGPSFAPRRRTLERSDTLSDAMHPLLAATPLLDLHHPDIEALVTARGWRALRPYDRIGAVYDFVRNQIASATTKATNCRHPACWPTASGSATPRARC
jgi:hypothetical protein